MSRVARQYKNTRGRLRLIKCRFSGIVLHARANVPDEPIRKKYGERLQDSALAAWAQKGSILYLLHKCRRKDPMKKLVIAALVFGLYGLNSIKDTLAADKNSAVRNDDGWLLYTSPDQAPGWAHPKCIPAPTQKMGPFVELSNGSLMIIEGNATHVSKDDGRTWSQPRKMYDGPGSDEPGSGIPHRYGGLLTPGRLIRTADGVIIFAWRDQATGYKWDSQTRTLSEKCRSDVWMIRSLDEGATWVDRQRIHKGISGCWPLNIIQTQHGHVVLGSEDFESTRNHGTSFSFVSQDNGKNWRKSNVIDIGGDGHHDGATEPVVVELSDGRLWMVMRTCLDRFWQAFSDDGGLTWPIIMPTEIGASSSPCCIRRLASGRLVMAWNRLYPEGADSYPRSGKDDYSIVMASWFRKELSIAFSEDDGKSWSDPVVIAKGHSYNHQTAYPYIYERRPGELWVSVIRGGEYPFVLIEEDFLKTE